jgi:hypothetical protein
MQAHHYRTGRVNVVFTICHCSWTGRPYTVLTGNDMVQAGYRPTGAKAKLDSAFDWAMEQEFNQQVARPPVLTCCAVRGIP